MVEGVPAFLMVCRGVMTIKVCLCTAFVAVDGGGDGYFCTVGRLHRCGGGGSWPEVVTMEGGGEKPEEGRSAAAGRLYPPLR